MFGTGLVQSNVHVIYVQCTSHVYKLQMHDEPHHKTDIQHNAMECIANCYTALQPVNYFQLHQYANPQVNYSCMKQLPIFTAAVS